MSSNATGARRCRLNSMSSSVYESLPPERQTITQIAVVDHRVVADRLADLAAQVRFELLPPARCLGVGRRAAVYRVFGRGVRCLFGHHDWNYIKVLDRAAVVWRLRTGRTGAYTRST